MRIIQLSDTHFGTEVAEVIAALQTAIQQFQPHLILHTGDITQRARPDEFAAAKQLMEGFGIPFRIIPGNHDIPLFNIAARLFSPYANYRRAFQQREFIYETEQALFIGFDATHPLRHTHGNLKLAHVRRVLTDGRAQAGDKFLCISVHQPLYTPYEIDKDEALIDRHEIADLFAEFHVDLVLSGHVHAPGCMNANAFFKVPRNFILCNAGTAISWRIRRSAPNGFNCLELENNQLRISQMGFQIEGKIFALENEWLGYYDDGQWQVSREPGPLI